MGRKYRRKKYLVNREIQLKYMLLVVTMLFLYTFFLLMAIFWPQLQAFANASHLARKAAEAGTILALHQSFWPAVVVVIALFGLGSIFVTHRIAGPLYSIDRTITEMAAGNLTVRARIRRGDDLQEFRHNFNAMADNLERLLIDLELGCRCLSECGQELERELAGGHLDKEKIAKLLVRMKGDREKFRRDLQRFTFRHDR